MLLTLPLLRRFFYQHPDWFLLDANHAMRHVERGAVARRHISWTVAEGELILCDACLPFDWSHEVPPERYHRLPADSNLPQAALALLVRLTGEAESAAGI